MLKQVINHRADAHVLVYVATNDAMNGKDDCEDQMETPVAMHVVHNDADKRDFWVLPPLQAHRIEMET